MFLSLNSGGFLVEKFKANHCMFLSFHLKACVYTDSQI